jgi:hypothetical protein
MRFFKVEGKGKEAKEVKEAKERPIKWLFLWLVVAWLVNDTK